MFDTLKTFENKKSLEYNPNIKFHFPPGANPIKEILSKRQTILTSFIFFDSVSFRLNTVYFAYKSNKKNKSKNVPKL